jgi:hypothetical protein
MDQLNDALLQFFGSHFKPGIIGLVGTKDLIGLAIREAQRPLTLNGTASLWSHCFLFGEERLDRRGPGNTTTKSPYLFESDLKINLFKPQLRNGAQENWLGKWCKGKIEQGAVIDFGLSEDEKRDILATALQRVDEQVLYPHPGASWNLVEHHYEPTVARQSRGRSPCHVLQLLCETLLPRGREGFHGA